MTVAHYYKDVFKSVFSSPDRIRKEHGETINLTDEWYFIKRSVNETIRHKCSNLVGIAYLNENKCRLCEKKIPREIHILARLRGYMGQ